MPSTDTPRELDIDDATHAMYMELVESEVSPFWRGYGRGAPMKDVFVFSVAMGYRNKSRTPLRKRKGSIPFTTFNDDEKWLMKVIAIAERGGLEVLFDEKEVYKIAEEYANAGVRLLHNFVFGEQPGDIDKRIEADVRVALSKGDM